MEFSTLSKSRVKHTVTITTAEEGMSLRVTRHRTLGGVPMSISLPLDEDISFSDAMRKVKNIAELDDDMYVMLVEVQSDD